MKASDLFVKQLEEEGVEYIFGIPGEENLDFLESLRKSKSIKLVITRHEQAAGFMAATYGRLTGKVGVCISTLGPGATNFVTAAAYAQLGGMPMCMITGQKPIRTSKQGRFQIIDVVEMMSPLTKSSVQIVSGENISPLIRDAFRVAQEERPGAVHLELPEDIAAENVADPHILTQLKTRRPIAEEKAISKAVEMIHQAKRPLLLIGAGGNRKLTAKTLRDFVDKTGMYFCNTQMGKGVIDERHEKYLGTAALSDNDYIHCAISRADLIINVGHDVVEKPPFFMHHQDGRKVIHINYLSAQVDQIYFPQHEVQGDIANSIWQITEKVSKQESWDFEYFDRINSDIQKHISQKAYDDRFPIIPQRLVADVRNVMPSDGILALDNGMYKIWFARNYKAHASNTILLDNALATMGAGLPSAIAAKLVHPEKQVMAIAGDGGFMMNSQELQTAVSLGLDLVVLVLNDNAYGMIKWKQEGMEFEDFGLDLQNPNFIEYANSYGANGHRVESADQLTTVIEKAYSDGGVHVIEVPIDYSENHKVLTQELHDKTCIL